MSSFNILFLILFFFLLAQVLLVRKIDTNRVYAMKVLNKAEIVRRDEVEHTRTEREVLANLGCPFIVALRYSFQSPEKLYFIFDYFSGGELFYHMQRERIFSEDRVRFYSIQLTLALEYLHAQNIVFRDLKPENILIDGEGHLAITDLGLCKIHVNNDEGARTFCGTAEYLAPEIIAGKKYGKAVDWWSLGTLVYEMLTGLPPFYSENTNIMYRKILSDELCYPSHVSQTARSFIDKVRNEAIFLYYYYYYYLTFAGLLTISFIVYMNENTIVFLTVFLFFFLFIDLAIES